MSYDDSQLTVEVCHAGCTHLAYGKFSSLASVGVRIVGRCKELRQRLEVHICSCYTTEDERRVTVSNAGSLTFTEIGRSCSSRVGYDGTGIENKNQRSKFIVRVDNQTTTRPCASDYHWQPRKCHSHDHSITSTVSNLLSPTIWR